MSDDVFFDALCEALQDAFWRAADDLLWRHTNPWELDEALVAAGYGMGPCEAMDLVGLNRVLARRQPAGSPILARMVAEGRVGKQGSVGHYRYPGGGGAVIDPLIEDLILEEAHFAKAPRREISDAEIVSYMQEAQARATALAVSGAVLGAVSGGPSEGDVRAACRVALHAP